MAARARIACALLIATALGWSPALAAPAPAPVTSSGPGEPDPRALDLAREIIRLGYPEGTRAAMFNGVIDSMTGQISTAYLAQFNNDPAAKAILDRSLVSFVAAGKSVMARHIPGFMEAYAIGYARIFPIGELEQILAFVKTPAGAHFVQRSPAIVSDPAFAAANQDYLRDLQPLIEQMRNQVTRELLLYYRDHPPKPSSGS